MRTRETSLYASGDVASVSDRTKSIRQFVKASQSAVAADSMKPDAVGGMKTDASFTDIERPLLPCDASPLSTAPSGVDGSGSSDEDGIGDRRETTSFAAICDETDVVVVSRPRGGNGSDGYSAIGENKRSSSAIQTSSRKASLSIGGGGVDRSSASTSSAASTTAHAAEVASTKPTCQDVQAAVVRCVYHRVVLGSMMVCGLFFPRHFKGLCARRWRAPLMTYSSVVLALITFNTARVVLTSFDREDSATASRGGGDALFYKINIVCWLVVCTLNYVLHYWMSSARGALRRYYVKMVAVRQSFCERGICGNHEGAARLEICCLSVGWLLVLANTAYLLYGISVPGSVLFPSDVYFRLWRPTATQPAAAANASNATDGALAETTAAAAAATDGSSAIAGRVLFGLPVFYYSASWIWPVVYFIDVSMHTNHMFADLNRHMRASAKRGCLLVSIDVYRQLHRKACKVVCIANGYFKYLLGSNMFFYLVLSMVQLYSVLWSPSMHDPSKVDLLVAFVVWLCASVVILAAVCVAASATSTRARECLEILLKLNEKREEIGNKELLEMELFVAKLQSSIGYTSMDMFVVSKEVTLTVCGAWLTYFLLIVQFHPPS